jgi:hypothetical protein
MCSLASLCIINREANTRWLQNELVNELTKKTLYAMGSLEAPLLPPVPAPAVEGCPGCAMEWRKENSNVRIPYKEFFFVGVTTLASGIYIHHPYICLYMVRLVVARVWEWFSFCPSRDNDERRHHIVGKMLEWIQ